MKYTCLKKVLASKTKAEWRAFLAPSTKPVNPNVNDFLVRMQKAAEDRARKYSREKIKICADQNEKGNNP